MPVEPLGEPIVIRFDGLDADHHEIELSTLAKSLDGLSKVIAAAAHFALTQEIALRKDKRDLRVVIRPPRDGCVIIDAIVQLVHEHPTITTYASSALANLTSGIITYIFARNANKREEVKYLAGALERAIAELGAREASESDRFLDTIDKMSDALSAAVKRSVEPVGVTARTMTIGVLSAPRIETFIDEPTKAAILSETTLKVDDERLYEVKLSELDLLSGSCHVHITGEPDDVRRPAKITDPELSLPNNAYAVSMAAMSRIRVHAKATLREGEIDRLYISNHEGRSRGEPDFTLAP